MKIMRLLGLCMMVATFVFINTAYADIQFGNAHGSIILAEYFDYNCPICREYMPVINALASRNPQLDVIQRVVPVLARSSQVVDRAVLAAYFQGKFSQMQQAILQVHDRETIPTHKVFHIAKYLQINLKRLLHDMNSMRVKQQLIDNIRTFSVLHKQRVPVVVIYNRKRPAYRLVLVGEQSLAALQLSIDTLTNK